MKGEERVCHVTEAGTHGADCAGVSEEVSSCEAAYVWAPACAGACPADAGSRVLSLCAAVSAAFPQKETPGSSAREGHLVDALALRGDEGRGTLRKARGRCERSVIPGSPNGATHPARGITI